MILLSGPNHGRTFCAANGCGYALPNNFLERWGALRCRLGPLPCSLTRQQRQQTGCILSIRFTRASMLLSQKRCIYMETQSAPCMREFNALAVHVDCGHPLVCCSVLISWSCYMHPGSSPLCLLRYSETSSSDFFENGVIVINLNLVAFEIHGSDLFSVRATRMLTEPPMKRIFIASCSIKTPSDSGDFSMTSGLKSSQSDQAFSGMPLFLKHPA